jgi:hypothetical protein
MAIIDPKSKKATWYEADHGEQRDPFRDWIRRRCRSGNEGFVCEDLDIVINCYGEWIGRNHSDDGRIKLIEKKFDRDMKYAQKKTFELLDKLLKTADPKAKFYRGLYTVKLPLVKKAGKTKCEVCKGSGYTDTQMNDEDFDMITFIVRKHQNGNTKLMNAEEFIRFLEDRDLKNVEP